MKELGIYKKNDVDCLIEYYSNAQIQEEIARKKVKFKKNFEKE